MNMIEKSKVIEAIGEMTDDNGFVIPNNFAKCARKIFSIKEINLETHDAKVRADAIDEYKDKLIKRLIPFFDMLSSADESETYLAITQIAEQMKGEQRNGNS